MGRQKDGKEQDLSHINFRLTPDETRRFSSLMERVWERSCGYGYKSDVVKELMGLRPLLLVHEEDCQLLFPTRREGAKLVVHKPK